MDCLSGQALKDATGHKLVGLSLGFCEDDSLAKDLLLHGVGALLLDAGRRVRERVGDLELFVVIVGVFVDDILGDLHSDYVLKDSPLGLDAGGKLDGQVPDRLRHPRSSLLTGGIDLQDIFVLVPAPELLDPAGGCGGKQQALRLCRVGRSHVLQNGLCSDWSNVCEFRGVGGARTLGHWRNVPRRLRRIPC